MRYVMPIVAMMLSVSAAQAETAWVYDGDGNLAGTVQSAGPNAAFIYDEGGNLAGSTARAGNSTYVYGADGGYRGAVINSQPFQRDLNVR